MAHVQQQLSARPAAMVQLLITQAVQLRDSSKFVKAERVKANAKIEMEFAKNQANIARVKENSERIKERSRENNKYMFEVVRVYAKQHGYCMNFLAHAKCERADCRFTHKYLKDGQWYQRKSEQGAASAAAYRDARTEDAYDYYDMYDY